MKTITITGVMADFLDSIRAYEHESGKAIHFDERESSEFVNMYFNNGGKLKIEEKELLFITEDGIKITEHRTAVILVDEDFIKQYKPSIDCNINTVVVTTKLFFHESNADEYIWKNKPVFSYEDIIDFNTVEEGMWYDIKAIAKERI